jgi:hypothetical protein
MCGPPALSLLRYANGFIKPTKCSATCSTVSSELVVTFLQQSPRMDGIARNGAQAKVLLPSFRSSSVVKDMVPTCPLIFRLLDESEGPRI